MGTGMGMNTMQQNQNGFPGAAQQSGIGGTIPQQQMGGIPNQMMMMSPQMMGPNNNAGFQPQGGVAQFPPQQVPASGYSTAGQFFPQQVTISGQVPVSGQLSGSQDSQLSSGQLSSSQDSQRSSGQPPIHQDIPTESPVDEVSTPNGRKRSECMVQRSESMGVMETRFDALMDDIRDTNPHNILRRVSSITISAHSNSQS